MDFTLCIQGRIPILPSVSSCGGFSPYILTLAGDVTPFGNSIHGPIPHGPPLPSLQSWAPLAPAALEIFLIPIPCPLCLQFSPRLSQALRPQLLSHQHNAPCTVLLQLEIILTSTYFSV